MFETIGDAVYAAFADPRTPSRLRPPASSRSLEEDWEPLGQITVRMGLHTGDVERRTPTTSAPLYRCARLMATAHGGQIVLSETTAKLVERPRRRNDAIDLGKHRLKDLAASRARSSRLPGGPRCRLPAARSPTGRPNNLPSDGEDVRRPPEELATFCGLLRAGRPGRDDHGARRERQDAPGAAGARTRCSSRSRTASSSSTRPARRVGAGLSGDRRTCSASRRPRTGPVESLVTHLGGKELLLVLDNFEHVVAAAALDVAVLAACPTVDVLVDEPRAAAHPGRARVPVRRSRCRPDASSVDDLMRSPAVQLFVERAREIRRLRADDDENGSAVGRICRRLDGLPLAIELAAARTRLLSPEAMLERSTTGSRLLTGAAGRPAVATATLRNTIGWSYDLLERAATSRSCGGWRSSAAAATWPPRRRVCGGDDVLDVALHPRRAQPRRDALEPSSASRASSCWRRSPSSRASGSPRAARATRSPRVTPSTSRSSPRRSEPALQRRTRPWLSRLADDRDNIRAALAWSVEHDEARSACGFSAALWLWWWTSFSEGLGWAEQCSSCPVRPSRRHAPGRSSRRRSARPAPATFGRHDGTRKRR